MLDNLGRGVIGVIGLGGAAYDTQNRKQARTFCRGVIGVIGFNQPIAREAVFLAVRRVYVGF